MAEVYVFFADGHEEVEALTAVDLLRRAGIETEMISITGKLEVTSSHRVTLKCDRLIEDIEDDASMLVLPGGLPGTNHLKADKRLAEMIIRYRDEGKYLAAICAAPTVYGQLGLLKDKKACCYPDMEDELCCMENTKASVTVDGQFITSRGLGTAIDFGLALVSILRDKNTADKLANKIVYKQ